jgi:hypothetical protein
MTWQPALTTPQKNGSKGLQNGLRMIDMRLSVFNRNG